MTVRTNKLVVGGTKDTDGMDFIQATQDGANDKPAYRITSTASQNGIDLGDSNQFSFTDGSGNDRGFSLLFAGKFAPIGAYDVILTKYNNSVVAEREWYFQRQTTGELRFSIQDTSSNSALITTNSTFSSKAETWGTLLATYSGSKSHTGMKIYVDGVLQSSAGSTAGGYAGMSNTAGRVMVGIFQNSYIEPWRREFNRAIIFNYDLSAFPEKVRRYSAGAKLDFEDIGGTNNIVPSASSTFSSDGTAWWQLFRATIAYNAGTGDATVTENSVLVSDTFGMQLANAISGKRYKVTFRVKSSTISTVAMRVTMNSGSGIDANVTAVTNPLLTTSYQSYEFIGLATSQYVAILPNGSFDFSTPPVEEFTIDDIVVQQLGAVLDLEPEGIGQGPGWLDSSGNMLHGTAYSCQAINLPTPIDCRNHVINGDFDLWQRGATFASTGGSVYTADRWYQYSATGASIYQSSGTYSKYGCKVQRNSGQTFTSAIYLCSCFETVQVLPLRAKLVTVSFWARKGTTYSHALSALAVRLATGTGTEGKHTGSGFTGLTSPIDTQFTLTTTLTKYTVTGLIPSNATQMELVFYYTPTGTAGAEDSFTIEQVMLNVGATAAPFSLAGGNIAGELALCQRYYWRFNATTIGDRYGAGFSPTTTTFETVVQNPVPMRIPAPSVETSGAATDYSVYSTLGAVVCSAVPTRIVSSVVTNALTFTVAAGLTAGYGGHSRAATTSGYLGFPAEL
jgi:hypothetical protein